MAKMTLSGVSLDYPVFDLRARSLKHSLMRLTSGGAVRESSRGAVIVRALDDVNIELNPGDRLALVGHNGAGKSTLLRTMAGIYEPTLGTVSREGRITPIFSATFGMQDELSGMENIFLRGLHLGYSRDAVEAHIDEIVEFTELGDFLDMPLRTYSAGMKVRLAFAVCTAFSPEILLLDEWIGAGDMRFMQRAKRRIQELISRASIMVLATHSLPLLRQNCNRAIMLEHGKIVAAGGVDEVIGRYEASIEEK